MKFAVTLKGIHWYSGKLSDAYAYVKQTWGSTEAAWEKGVKLTPAIPLVSGR